MADKETDRTTLSRAEREMVKRIAERDGVTEDEAATRLVKEALARRVKKKSGKPPARVYQIKRK